MNYFKIFLSFFVFCLQIRYTRCLPHVGCTWAAVFHIDISHVFVTEITFAVMICQLAELCPVQDLYYSVGKFAMHSGSTDTAEAFVCLS
jgi:hypothetical protein